MRMRTLIKELLDFSRVGRRDKPFENVSVEEVIQEALTDYQMVIKDNDAKIVIGDNLPTIFAIRFRIKQLISNIISNSLKFRSDKQPVINIDYCIDHDHWLFCIKDNGIGIDPQYFDRIFGIFKRLYSRDEYPGTGIGLALCKRIVETHGGKIWVDSEENKGTCVYFTIPRHMKVPEVISL
jgi:light-regulated signal transduction histidine kinase (bacteriophytochrome)